jgi:hypothetical protein
MSTHQDGDPPYEHADDPHAPNSPGLEPVLFLRPKTPASKDGALHAHSKPVSSSQPKDDSATTGRQKNKRSNRHRRKFGYSPGDFVLLQNLDPNRPDLAKAGSERPLPVSSGPSSDDDSMDSDGEEIDLDELVAAKIARDDMAAKETDRLEAARAKQSMDYLRDEVDHETTPNPPERRPDLHTDGPLTSFKLQSNGGLGINNINGSVFGPQSTAGGEVKPASVPSPLSPIEPHARKYSSPAQMESLTTSSSAYLRSPKFSNRLPALQNAGSPNAIPNPSSPPNMQILPSVGILLDEVDKQNVARQRQHSMSSISPSLHFSSASNPPTPYGVASVNHASPTSLDSATSPKDWAPKLSMHSPFMPNVTIFRRPSNVPSDYPSLPSAASTSDSYNTSPEGFSPSAHTNATSVTTPSDRGARMSMDARVLPMPQTPNGIAMSPRPVPSGGPSAGPSPAASHSMNAPLSAGLAPPSATLPPPSAKLPPLPSLMSPTTPKLPLPAGSMGSPPMVHTMHQPGGMQTVPAHGTAGYKCDHPGCTAPPFQTQYLLK